MADLRRARKTDERTSVAYHNPRKAPDPLSPFGSPSLPYRERTFVPRARLALTCARHNVGFPRPIDISIVVDERPAARHLRR